MEMIYAGAGTKVYIPREITGDKGKSAMEAVHGNTSAIIFWYLDEVWLDSTPQFHHMFIYIHAGIYLLNIIDDLSESLKVEFLVCHKE